MLHNIRLVYELLNRRERLQVAALGAGMLVTGIMEMVGVGSVLPFMQLASDPSVLEGSGWLARANEYVGFESTEAATLAAGVLLFVAITANNLLNVVMVWAIAGWGWGLNHRLSTALLERYVRQPYSFFLGRNTANLNRTLLTEVGSVVSGVLIPGMAIAARSVGSVLVVVLLAAVDVRLAALLFLSLGGSYALVYLLLRAGQRRRGVERFDDNGERFRIAAEALLGIKDLKALGREDEFLRRFAAPSRRFTRAVASNRVAAAVPRYVLETVGLGVIMIMVLGTIQGGAAVSSFLPVLSLYAFGAYRLLPSVNAIFNGAVVVRFNAPALEELHKELYAVDDRVAPGRSQPGPSVNGGGAGEQTGMPRQPPEDSHRPAGIEIKGLSYRYPDGSDDALRDIDLRIEPNAVVGFVGRTGAGKTTLVDVVLGLLTPTRGAVVIDGETLGPITERAWRTRCGYVPQDVFLTDDTVVANIAFGVPPAHVDRVAATAAARIAQLHDFIEGLPQGYDTIVGERGVRMSGGQRQRLGIARALYHDPEVLIFDEATSALDGATESAVLDTIDALASRKTILVIAHRLTTVKACDVIHVLEDGRIVADGAYDTLLSRHPGFRAMAGELPV